MSKQTNEFQQLVLRIYAALAGITATVEESALLKEKNSDAKREVDVLVTTSVAGHTMKVAVECRDYSKDQDITWIDTLIGKYANLDVQKVVAVSHTDYSESAAQKAAQHDIELLTLKEAQGTDWASKLAPSAFQLFAFRNRPMIVGLWLSGVEQLKIEYTFEGETNSDGKLPKCISQFFLELWQTRKNNVAAKEISEYVISNWDRIAREPNTPRYCEITERFRAPRTLSIGTLPTISFDTIVWGVGTKYNAETLAPTKWVIGDKVALIASALDDQGKALHITLVADQAGELQGARVELQHLVPTLNQ